MEVLWNLDTLQYEGVQNQWQAAVMVATKQLRLVGFINRNGKKYLKYRLVKWKN